MSELTDEEIFYGMGMSDESSDGDVSRLITEEDLIDSLFHLCDPDKTGRTPASHIIDFVKFTISVPEICPHEVALWIFCDLDQFLQDHSADLDNLRHLLDPDNTDALVDLDTCRFQISQWIEKIKPESVLADGPIVMKTPAKRPLCGVLDNESNRQNFDQEDFLRPLDLRVDSPAGNLRKKLIEKKEENLKLRKDLESAEETSMFQSQKLDEMTKRIKSLQELVERREYAMAENADLKLTIATLEEEKKDQAERVKQLKKLNSNFKEQVFDLEQKLVKAQADVQIAEKQQNDIQENLFKQKHLWARTQEEKDLLEARLTENSYKVGELNGTIDSLKKVNCELKDQKMELELQLADTQQQLSLLKMKAAQFGVPDLSHGSDDEMIPVQGPSAVSTPKSNKGPKMSIGLELKRMLEDDKHLPSPLCERAWGESLCSNLSSVNSPTSQLRPYNDQSRPSLSFLRRTPLSEKFNNLSTSVMKEVTEKQEEMIEKISKFADGANTNDKRKTTASPVTFKKTIKKDFDFLSKKLYSLSAAMKTAEQRTSRMVAAYEQLKDENVRLRAVYEDSLQQMLDDSGGGQMSVDDRMQQVKEKLERGEQHIIDLEENIKALKSHINNLQTEKASLKHAIEEVQAEKESMVLEIKHLKRNNLEVAEKFHKAELKCSELGEELQNSNTIISRERQKYKHLEENLGQSQFEHRVDLEEIWKVIQKEVERDHQTEQEELQKTANSLKSQVAKEITTLKSQLYKTQATLTALKQKTKQLELPLGKPELNHSHASQTVEEDSTSPLVDALTIDFFDGTQLTRRNSRKLQARSTLEDGLCGTTALSGNLCSGDLAVSCPSLTSQNELVTSGTQTEEQQSYTYSSSTSGVLDLDVSSGTISSLDGRCRRKNFARTFHRFDSDSQTSQSIESNTDTDGSLPRQRSPSFLAAIEGSRYDHATKKDDGLKSTDGFSLPIDSQFNGPMFPRSRSSSFQAAIESSQRTPTEEQCCMDFSPSNDNTPENPSFPDYVTAQWGGDVASVNSSNNIKLNNRTVSFLPLQTEACYSNNNNMKQLDQRTVSFISPLCVQNDNIGYNNSYVSSFDHQNCNQNQPSSMNMYRSTAQFVPERKSCQFGQNTTCTSAETVKKLPQTTSIISPPTEERQFSPTPVRKLSTLVEEESDWLDNSSQDGTDEKTRRLVLESSFHDNGRVLTTFTDSPTPQTSSPAINRPSSPPRYSSTMSVKLNNTSSPNSPRCCLKRISQEGCQASPSILPRSSHQPSGPTVAYTPPVVSPDIGSRSPLLSEKSSLVAKANREKQLKNKPEGSATVKSATKKDKESFKGKGAKRNLARLIIEHDAANNNSTPSTSSATGGLTPERDVMDGRDVSPKGKNSPLTRHPSIHEESEGRVSFHPVTLLAQSQSSVLVEQSKETEKKESKETCPEEETDQFFPLARRSKPPGRSPNSSKPAVSLEKVKEANLAKRREQLKHSTMPQLSELSETVSVQNGSPMDSGDCSVGDLSSQSTGSVTGMGDTPIKNPAYPSLPNDVLVNLGLAAGDKSDSIEQLNDQEVEEKFAQLALAFKTDKLTLEQRLSIQQRSRDLAEQNVEKEFQGVKDCTASLSQLCEKTEAVALLKTLQGHFEILQQSIVRVSSRAEVYGAVQQEDRMSKAIDVMIKHVENLKMIHEKEHVELEEARKFLQDNRVYNSIQGADLGPFDSMNLSKRSLSLAGNALVKRNKAGGPLLAVASAANKLLEGARRRNSVSVLPKMLGGMGGSFSLNQSSSMESISFSDTSLRGTSGEWATCDEDPKTRFQCAVANTTVRSAVTGVMRRASLDKSPPISTLNLSKSSVIEKPSSDRSSEAVADQKTNSSSDTNKKGEEDAFQRGFEQGVRAHLGREMTGLREQQQDFCDTLDHLMDQNELSSEEAECDKTDTSVIEKLWRLCPECYSPESGRRIRFTLAGFVCLMAMVSVFFTILPVGVASSLDHSDLPPM